jgi:hypothetical protein
MTIRYPNKGKKIVFKIDPTSAWTVISAVLNSHTIAPVKINEIGNVAG